MLVTHRDWGHAAMEIVVNPGASLSLQMQNQKAEHWLMATGTPVVETDGIVVWWEKTRAPPSRWARCTNPEQPEKIPVDLIGLQSRAYQGEDDIVRLEDRQSRSDQVLMLARTEASVCTK